jgi:hypothetical protein
MAFRAVFGSGFEDGAGPSNGDNATKFCNSSMPPKQAMGGLKYMMNALKVSCPYHLHDTIFMSVRNRRPFGSTRWYLLLYVKLQKTTI